ncbi:LysR substrate-binding domain-containing protein [Bradyrhizobium sp.]|uniref:LysR substrate-binding domain-containing protein n=1 Tax=Bradyrhizobium sp. TaxID=376 RepID=UPI003C67A724
MGAGRAGADRAGVEDGARLLGALRRRHHTYLQLQAAIDGLGIALGSLPLIEADIAAGRLVCPLAAPELRDDDYQLVIREDRLRDPAIKAF